MQEQMHPQTTDESTVEPNFTTSSLTVETVQNRLKVMIFNKGLANAHAENPNSRDDCKNFTYKFMQSGQIKKSNLPLTGKSKFLKHAAVRMLTIQPEA